MQQLLRRESISLLVAAAIGVALALAAASAGAEVLVDNLGSDATRYHTIYGPNAAGLNEETAGGISFTTASSYYLNSISIVAKYASGSSASFELALYSDNAGLPGSQIAAETVSAGSIGAFRTYSANFGTAAVLAAGTTYWAVVQATGADNNTVLYLQRGPYDQNNSPFLPSARRAMYGNMSDPGAPYWMHMWNPGVQVTGSPVPEPSALLALGTGTMLLAGLAGRRRRNR